MSFPEVRYRPLSGRILAVATVVVCALGAVTLVVADPVAALRYVWALALIATLAWALFWLPRLSVEEHGITVRNVFRTHFVPWPSIVSIDTRFALTLHTVTGKVPVWAAPAPGRHRTMGLARRDFDGIGESARGPQRSLRPSDALSTTSGGLAHVIRTRWERLRDEGAFAHGVDAGAATVTWHRATIAVTAVLAAATVLGLLV